MFSAVLVLSLVAAVISLDGALTYLVLPDAKAQSHLTVFLAELHDGALTAL